MPTNRKQDSKNQPTGDKDKTFYRMWNVVFVYAL